MVSRSRAVLHDRPDRADREGQIADLTSSGVVGLAPGVVADDRREHGLDSARGWVVVAAAFVSMFVVFGIVYSFGAFFDSMAEDFGTGKGATALMFSITTAWYFGLGLVSGKAADRFGPRPLLIVAAAVLGVALLLTSRVTSIWLGYLTYGVGVGIAVACAYVPMVAAVGGWFVSSRTAALGVAVAGIGVGTLVVAPISERLIDAFGWRTAYLVLGIVGAALLLVASVGAWRPPTAVVQEPVPLGRIIRHRGFVTLYAATALVSAALFVPFIFIKDYATDHGIDSGPATALVSVIGASSVIGRLGMGGLGARLGATRLMQLSFVTMTLSFVIWLSADGSYGRLVMFAVVMGVAYGGFIALAPAVTAGLFGTVGLGAVLGALYTAAAIGGLVGPPIVGAVIDRVSYGAGIALAMAITAASTVVLFTLPAGHDRRG
jgi:predicted MFS family arabinose efflux permease